MQNQKLIKQDIERLENKLASIQQDYNDISILIKLQKSWLLDVEKQEAKDVPVQDVEKVATD